MQRVRGEEAAEGDFDFVEGVVDLDLMWRGWVSRGRLELGVNVSGSLGLCLRMRD